MVNVSRSYIMHSHVYRRVTSGALKPRIPGKQHDWQTAAAYMPEGPDLAAATIDSQPEKTIDFPSYGILEHDSRPAPNIVMW